MSFKAWLVLPAIVLPLALAGCGGADSTEPTGSPVPASLRRISGDGQSGVVGAELTDPLVVEVRDATGSPLQGQVVTWAVAVGQGSVVPARATTDASGTASARWTLRGNAGSQSATATVGSLAPVSFTARGQPDSPTTVAIVSGDGQTGTVGQPLYNVLVVKVSDSFGNGIADVAVTWEVTGGTGEMSPTSDKTNDFGLASATWTLGTTTGEQIVEARVEGLDTALFTATAGAGSVASINILAGNAQTAEVGAPLPDSLVVELLDEHGNVRPGATVVWSAIAGNGSTSPGQSISDPSGRASTQWVLGTTPGVNEVTATVSDLSPVTFNATAELGSVSLLNKIGGDGSVAGVGELLPDSLVVRVTDKYGNPKEGVVVDWTVPYLDPWLGDNGTVAPASGVSDSEGLASTAWTLGSLVGTQTANASIPTMSIVAFEATANLRFVQVDAASILTCGLTATGMVYCWGNIPRPRPGPALVVLAAGGYVCGLDADGTAWCYDVYDRSWSAVPGGLSFVSITSGGPRCGVTADGSAYCWGGYSPTPVAVPGGLTFAMLDVGYADTCGVTQSGAAYCWGQFFGGPTNTPELVADSLVFESISAGWQHECAVAVGGDAYCWGSNLNRELGAGNVGPWSDVPVAVVGGLKFVSVDAGGGDIGIPELYRHTCGLTANGEAYCWGSNARGQLGKGNSPLSDGPNLVVGGHVFSSVTVGSAHSCGLADAVYCWGDNSHGQMGIDSSERQYFEPVRVYGQQ